MRSQPKTFTRLLLAASISIASFSLVACGGSDSSGSNSDQVNNSGDSDQNNGVNNSVDKDASFYLASYKGSIAPTTVTSWEASSHDDYVNQLKVKGNDLHIIKQWYNGVTKLAVDSTNATSNFVGFAALTTAGHHVESSDEDYVSGASEHKILDSWYADDDSAMYALVAQAKGDTPAEDTASGLFKVDLNDDGSVPFIERNGKKIYHEGAAVTRVGQDLNLIDALPLPDGRVVALDSKNKAVAVYSSDLALDQASSFALAEGSELQTDSTRNVQWVANKDSLFLLVKDKNDVVTVEKRSLSNLATVVKSVTVEAGTNIENLDTNENTDYVVVAGEHTFALLDKDLNAITSTKLPNEVMGLSLSTDGKRVALTTEKPKELVLIDIDQKKPALTSIQLESEVYRFEMGDKNSLFVSDDKGKSLVKKISLTEKPVAMSAQEIAEFANSNIAIENLNHGHSGTVIRKDLELPTDSIQGVQYNWTSSNTAVINTDGKVNQPEIGSPSIDVTISVSTTAMVDNKQAVATKDFTFTVLPKSKAGNYDSSIALNDEAKEYSYREFASNQDGSKVAGFARKKGKVLIVDSASKAQNIVNLPTGYEKADALAMSWKNNNTLLVFASSDTKAVLELNIDTNTWNTVGDMNKNTYKVDVSNVNNTFTALQVSEDRESCSTTTYNLNDFSTVATYALSECDVYRLVVSSDGKVVFGSKHEHPPEGGHLNGIARYNEGKMDSYKHETDGFVYAWKQIGNKLVGGDSSSNFHVIDNAFGINNLQANNIKTVETARAGDGGHHAPGRIFNIDGNDTSIVLMLEKVGLSIYKQQADSYVEDTFIEDSHISRFVMSTDKKKGFAYDSKDKKINIINFD